MKDWKIVLLHTKRTTLLKRVFEAAFPGRVVSLFVPALKNGSGRCLESRQEELLSYFRRYVYDSGIWDSRVLSVYGDGDFHHYTYAFSRLAAERKGFPDRHRPWTYFHFDNHRDDWGTRNAQGFSSYLNCANFVDSIAHDHFAIPFFVGPDVYPFKDSRGYRIGGREIPIYSNHFSKHLQRSRDWSGVRLLPQGVTGTHLPARADLQETPRPAYLSFDLDMLSRREIATNFEQNERMTVRRLCQMVDRVREYKEVFSADILGFPDDCNHPLSALTVLILAKKILGRGINTLLSYHSWIKSKQAFLIQSEYCNLKDRNRISPVQEGELLEVVRG